MLPGSSVSLRFSRSEFISIEHSRFILPFDDKLKCPICYELLCNPTQCPQGHLFCHECINKSADTRGCICPMDRQPFVKSQLQPNLFVQNHIYDLHLHCRYNVSESSPDSICLWVGPLHNLARHEVECPFKPVECPYNGCGESILRSQLDSHLTACPHRIVSCEFCSQNIKFQDSAQHRAGCAERPMACPNVCGEELIFRREHLPVCPLEPVECPLFALGYRCTSVSGSATSNNNSTGAPCCGNLPRRDLSYHLAEHGALPDTVLLLCREVKEQKKRREVAECEVAALTRRLQSSSSQREALARSLEEPHGSNRGFQSRFSGSGSASARPHYSPLLRTSSPTDTIFGEPMNPYAQSSSSSAAALQSITLPEPDNFWMDFMEDIEGVPEQPNPSRVSQSMLSARRSAPDSVSTRMMTEALRSSGGGNASSASAAVTSSVAATSAGRQQHQELRSAATSGSTAFEHAVERMQMRRPFDRLRSNAANGASTDHAAEASVPTRPTDAPRRPYGSTDAPRRPYGSGASVEELRTRADRARRANQLMTNFDHSIPRMRLPAGTDSAADDPIFLRDPRSPVRHVQWPNSPVQRNPHQRQRASSPSFASYFATADSDSDNNNDPDLDVDPEDRHRDRRARTIAYGRDGGDFGSNNGGGVLSFADPTAASTSAAASGLSSPAMRLRARGVDVVRPASAAPDHMYWGAPSMSRNNGRLNLPDFASTSSSAAALSQQPQAPRMDIASRPLSTTSARQLPPPVLSDHSTRMNEFLADRDNIRMSALGRSRPVRPRPRPDADDTVDFLGGAHMPVRNNIDDESGRTGNSFYTSASHHRSSWLPMTSHLFGNSRDNDARRAMLGMGPENAFNRVDSTSTAATTTAAATGGVVDLTADNNSSNNNNNNNNNNNSSSNNNSSNRRSSTLTDIISRNLDTFNRNNDTASRNDATLRRVTSSQYEELLRIDTDIRRGAAIEMHTGTDVNNRRSPSARRTPPFDLMPPLSLPDDIHVDLDADLDMMFHDEDDFGTTAASTAQEDEMTSFYEGISVPQPITMTVFEPAMASSSSSSSSSAQDSSVDTEVDVEDEDTGSVAAAAAAAAAAADDDGSGSERSERDNEAEGEEDEGNESDVNSNGDDAVGFF